jgi:hypothetical protein
MEILLGSFDSPVMSAFFDVKMNKRYYVSGFSKDHIAFTFWVKEFTSSALDCLIVKIKVDILQIIRLLPTQCANWNFSATLTGVFPCFFLSCKANARA